MNYTDICALKRVNSKVTPTIRKTKRPPFRKRFEEPYRVNDKITAPQVRLVGDNVVVDIYTRQEALRIAEEQNLDLVEISPKADPPVCKVVEYSKFKYTQKKKQ
ncbi:MAG: translation initiation factor IF-3, partial [Bacteroidota bacterium]